MELGTITALITAISQLIGVFLGLFVYRRKWDIYTVATVLLKVSRDPQLRAMLSRVKGGNNILARIDAYGADIAGLAKSLNDLSTDLPRALYVTRIALQEREKRALIVKEQNS